MLGLILDVYSLTCAKSRLATLATSLKLVFGYLLSFAFRRKAALHFLHLAKISFNLKYY